MRIGILHNNNNNFGGIENQILSLCDYIKNEHDIYFFTIFRDSAITKEIINRGIEVVILEGNLIKQYIQIKKAIDKYQINIFQFHTFDNGIKYRLLKLICPHLKIIIRAHTYIACSWIPEWKKKLYYLIDGISSILVEKYIVNGNYLKNEMLLKTLINPHKITSIIDGIKPIKFYEYIISQNDLLHLRMVMIANLIPHKGHDILIKGISLLKEQGVNVYCDVYGATDRDNKYRKEILELVSNLGLDSQITFKGFSKNIQKEILNYPIVCLPSDSEGTPNCIMEGMSAKRLVVVSDTGGVSEMVQDGITGFLHKPCDIEDFAETIKRVISTPVSELKEIMCRGYDFWKCNLSINRMCNKFNIIYSEL